VPELPSFDEIQAQIESSLRDLDELTRAASQERPAWYLTREGETGRVGDASAFAGALRATLVAMRASMGECRQAIPYSPMHPVRTSDGRLQWCCNHSPEHCGEE
jgi:hypothetical protein